MTAESRIRQALVAGAREAPPFPLPFEALSVQAQRVRRRRRAFSAVSSGALAIVVGLGAADVLSRDDTSELSVAEPAACHRLDEIERAAARDRVLALLVGEYRDLGEPATLDCGLPSSGGPVPAGRQITLTTMLVLNPSKDSQQAGAPGIVLTRQEFEPSATAEEVFAGVASLVRSERDMLRPDSPGERAERDAVTGEPLSQGWLAGGVPFRVFRGIGGLRAAAFRDGNEVIVLRFDGRGTPQDAAQAVRVLAAYADLPAPGEQDQTAPICGGVGAPAVFTWAGADGVPSPRCLTVQSGQAVIVRNQSSEDLNITLGTGSWTARAGSTLEITGAEVLGFAGSEGSYRLNFSATASAELRVRAVDVDGASRR